MPQQKNTPTTTSPEPQEQKSTITILFPTTNKTYAPQEIIDHYKKLIETFITDNYIKTNCLKTIRILEISNKKQHPVAIDIILELVKQKIQTYGFNAPQEQETIEPSEPQPHS